MPELSLLHVARSLSLFILAGLLEIGGGWLMWKWLRDRYGLGWGILGALIIVMYGVVPTLQTSHFGRVYAVYGGFFIVLSLLWGWGLDGNRPDRWDLIGASVAITGVCLMMYTPR